MGLATTVMFFAYNAILTREYNNEVGFIGSLTKVGAPLNFGTCACDAAFENLRRRRYDTSPL